MRRSAVFKRVDHPAKAFGDLIRRIAGQFERLEHDFRFVVPDRARDQFITVTGQIVLIAQNVHRIAVQCLFAPLGHRERVVAKVDRAGFRILFVHREIDDPRKGKAVLVGQVQFLTDDRAGLAGHAFEHRGFAAKEERCITDAKAQLLTDRLGPLGADVFGQRTGGFHFAVRLAPEDIAHPRQALFLGKGVHAVTEFTRTARRGGDRTDFGAVLFQQLGKDRKARTAEMFRHVLHLDRVAQVGLVRAVPFRRVLIGNLRPFGVDLTTAAEFLKNATDDRLNRVKHVLLADKGHFHVQLIEIGGRTVGARIFVAEARRNLEILVEPRHHDQLFELLGGLRQGVEFTGVQTRRHEEVARAFGRGRGDDRRLELAETLVPHAATDRGDHVRAQGHVVLHLFAAQIEVTIAQARFLRVFLIAKHHQRQFLGGAQNFQITHEDLDLTGRQFRVHQFGVTCLNGAVDADTPFGTHGFHLRKNWAIGVAQDLSDAIVIAQIDEQDAAVIADPVDPARQANGLAHVGFIKVSAGMAAESVHRVSPRGSGNGPRRYTCLGRQSQGMGVATGAKLVKITVTPSCF